MTENQRLKILINELKFKSQADFARALNITAGGLSDVIRQKGGIGVSDKIKRLLERSYDVNLEWLEKGKGDMLLPSKNKDLSTLNHEPPHNYMEQITKYLRQGKNSEDIIDITPVFNHHVTSERISTLLESRRVPDVLLLNGEFKDCDLVMRHTDPAMTGFIKKSSFIGVRQITEESYRDMIIPGKAYVIVLKNYVIERFVYPGVTKDLLLRSVDREMNPDFEILFDQIVELWLIKAWAPVFGIETV